MSVDLDEARMVVLDIVERCADLEETFTAEGPAGVCHACGRPVPQGFTDACRSCQWKGCKATTMEVE